MIRQTPLLSGRPMGNARCLLATAIVLVGAGALPPTMAAPLEREAPSVQAQPGDAQTVADFERRIGEYLALHKKVEDGLPGVPTKATPQQIDAGQQALSHGISKARAGAKVGDVFGPEIQAYLRRVLERAFSGSDRKQLRSSILDENPVGASVRVNGPYPDAIPLSTMPPQVLEVLPKLPMELEFRFIGDRLILFDNHAHIIVDYVDRALPRV